MPPHVARPARLLAERSRFPGSRSAIEAAFFLGRIAEDEGGDAIEWYDRYLSESGTARMRRKRSAER